MSKVGGKRVGAGRPQSSVGRRSVEVIAAAMTAGQTPAEFMLAMMRDTERELGDRKWAAAAVAPFIHPRPAPLPRMIKIDLPVTDTPEGIVTAAAKITAATAAGEIAPAEAQSLMSVLELQRKAIETVEIVRRIEALEARDKNA